MTITGRKDGRDFYPDTEAGAVELVKKFTAINDDVEWVTIMDPEVKGCWLVLGHSKAKGPLAYVVYLEHHPMGPDLEDVDPEAIVANKGGSDPTVLDWAKLWN